MRPCKCPFPFELNVYYTHCNQSTLICSWSCALSGPHVLSDNDRGLNHYPLVPKGNEPIEGCYASERPMRLSARPLGTTMKGAFGAKSFGLPVNSLFSVKFSY